MLAFFSFFFPDTLVAPSLKTPGTCPKLGCNIPWHGDVTRYTAEHC